jgi:hypothetical protein
MFRKGYLRLNNGSALLEFNGSLSVKGAPQAE